MYLVDNNRVRAEISYLDSLTDYRECLLQGDTCAPKQSPAQVPDDRQDCYETVVLTLLGLSALTYGALVLVFAT